MSTFNTIGILAHPRRPQTFPVANQIAGQLQARGVSTWVYADWTEPDVREAVQKADLVVAIGGDGAMLRAARVCAPWGVPVLGVNMGNLGFLTEIDDPTNCAPHFNRLLDGDHWIETRMMVQAIVRRDGEIITEEEALNDMVISRSLITNTARLEMYIDQDWATTYNADALIIATPTGSTAYNLSAGGPIVQPNVDALLLTLIAPHTLTNRPIVIPSNVTVRVKPTMEERDELFVTFDGQVGFQLEPNDEVEVRCADVPLRLIKPSTRSYFEVLRTKLKWGER